MFLGVVLCNCILKINDTLKFKIENLIDKTNEISKENGSLNKQVEMLKLQQDEKKQFEKNEHIELLEKIVGFTKNHCHSFPGLSPVRQAHDGTRVEDITKLMNDAKKNVLNSNIRIN